MSMKLQYNLSDELSEAIDSNYENQDYSGAIQDAILLLFETIRERTGLELDGSSLIGKAFGGSNPLLKINAFRTESQKNEQKGIENILRGIYLGIRNPRAHEKYNDDKNTGNSIIIFCDYLLSTIKESKAIFNIEDFCNIVFDDDFVESDEYASLIIKDIPKRKIYDTILELISRRSSCDPSKYSIVLKALLKVCTIDEQKQINNIVSEILLKTQDSHDIKVFTTLFEEENWKKLKKASRLRIENKLIKEIEKGKCNSYTNACESGGLGTWIIDIVSAIDLKDNFRSTILKKLRTENYSEVAYVFKYFSNHIIPRKAQPEKSLIRIINNGLKRGDNRYYSLVDFELIFGTDKWLKDVEENHASFEEKDLRPDDDLPF